MSGQWKELKKKYWPPGKDQLLILVLLGLLLAVIAVPAEDEKKATDMLENNPARGTAGETATDYESRMEEKLEELLSQVEGVGKVQVMLTFEGSGEKKVEKDVSSTGQESREETVYQEQGSSERIPYVTSEKNPKAAGVLIIAEGGGNSRIRQEILEAAQALFGIEAHKIKIMKMEGTQ